MRWIFRRFQDLLLVVTWNINVRSLELDAPFGTAWCSCLVFGFVLLCVWIILVEENHPEYL